MQVFLSVVVGEGEKRREREGRDGRRGKRGREWGGGERAASEWVSE